ncbi:NAD-dependent epimerase/dehydratase family protein [Rhizobium leguminosarum]|uniref:NAD-dependent epimerase/dehydratase family protein n=1 Tax=Rhizobium leguminosarum TaxID=384 RepID=UPI0021BBDBBF|nr:sugar nucleotide-binding protein [Rhizobium leguminosarum]
MSSTSHVYNNDNPHPGREEDPVDPKQAYPASKVAAEKELRESGLIWAIVRFPFVYGDGDGHLESLPKYVGSWHPAQRMSTIPHRDIATAMKLALNGSLASGRRNGCCYKRRWLRGLIAQRLVKLVEIRGYLVKAG